MTFFVCVGIMLCTQVNKYITPTHTKKCHILEYIDIERSNWTQFRNITNLEPTWPRSSVGRAMD